MQSLFKQRTFFLFLTLLYVIISFFQLKSLSDISNKYMQATSSIIGIEIFLFIGITGIVFFLLFHFIRMTENIPFLNWILGILFLLLTSIHWLAFDSALNQNGDNASYIINAISFINHGGFYYIYMPIVRPDLQAAIGLPLLLSPLYSLFGVNILAFKLVPFICTLISIVLCYLFLKQKVSHLIAILITTLFALNPYVTAFSSIVMTEIPYLMWSILSLYFFERFSKQKWSLTYALLFSVCALMTYFTRAVGIGIFAAVGLYTIYQINWNKNQLNFKTLIYNKYVRLMSLSVGLFFISYLLMSSNSEGTTQLSAFSQMDFTKQISENFTSIWLVLSQNIFTNNLIRFNILPLNILLVTVFFLILIGFVYYLRKKEFFAFYVFFVLIVIVLGNVAYQPLVVARYLLIFTPFFILFAYKGIKLISDKVKQDYTAPIISLFFISILYANFSGTAFNIQKANDGSIYNTAYGNFIELAEWTKQNISEDVVISSRKERIFFIFSGKKGFKHTGYRDRPNEKTFVTILNKFKRNNTDYVVLDTFSNTSINILLPLIQKNKDRFSIVKTIGEGKAGVCYLLKLNKWWEVDKK
jgi:4-amino-4-deoxy-L-arabinose transferase-like glycosyltransferase